MAEIGPVRAVITEALHPYTQGLMGSIPTLTQESDRLVQIPGAMPRLNAIPPGCAFNPRCARAYAPCLRERPEVLTLDGGRQVACWLHDPARAEEVPHD